MSHNTFKLVSKTPSVSGEISTFNLNDLSDVNAGSPTDQQFLKYVSASSEWQPADAGSVSTSISYILIGQGESNDYDNSTTETTITTSDALNLYDTAPVNNITSAVLNKVSGTDWIKSIDLPAGKYNFWLSYRVEFSGSGRLGFAIYKEGSVSKLSSAAFIGESLSIYAGTANILQSVINLSTSETIEIRPTVTVNIDNVNQQGNTPSEYSSLYIEKLS